MIIIGAVVLYLLIGLVTAIWMQDILGFLWPIVLGALLIMGITWLGEKGAKMKNPFKKVIPEPKDIAAGLVEQALLQYPEKWKDATTSEYKYRYEFRHKNIVVGVWELRWSNEVEARASIGGQSVEIDVIKFYEEYKKRETARKEFEKKHAYLNAIEEYLK